MREHVLSHKVKYDGSGKAPWPGELVERLGSRWLVVFYDAPPVPASTGERPRYGLRYHGMDVPVHVLVYFDGQGQVIEYHCDAGLPATVEGSDITFVDLDLDFIVTADFRGYARDYADFATNRERMGYNDKAVNAAEQGLKLARKLLKERATPFDGHAEALLTRVLATQGRL